MSRLLPLCAALLLHGCAATPATRPPPTEEEIEAAANQAIQSLDDAAIETQHLLGYVWHEAEDGRSVQYGVPQTDDRALRVDCRDGKLFVIVPTVSDAPEGAPEGARFGNGEQRDGSIEYLGDGANVVVPLAVDDPLVETLVTEDRIAIDTPGMLARVPGAGGSTLLSGLIERCRAEAHPRVGDGSRAEGGETLGPRRPIADAAPRPHARADETGFPLGAASVAGGVLEPCRRRGRLTRSGCAGNRRS